MPHVGIQRFAAGHDEEDGAKDDEPVPAVRAKKVDPCSGLNAVSTRGSRPIQRQPEDRDGHEPHDHDRAEQHADARRPARLDHEEADQDDSVIGTM